MLGRASRLSKSLSLDERVVSLTEPQAKILRLREELSRGTG